MRKLITFFLVLFISVQCYGNEFSYTSVAGGGGGDMLAATYDPGLVATPMAFQSVILTAGVGLSGGGDLSAARTFDLADTAVTPGSYTNTIITVNQQGQLTAASSGIGDLVPASTDSGQFLLGDGIGGWNPEPVADIVFDPATNALTVTSTSGAQFVVRYDVSNDATFAVDSSGFLRVNPGFSFGIGDGALGLANGSGCVALGINALGLTANRSNCVGIGNSAGSDNHGATSNFVGTFCGNKNFGNFANLSGAWCGQYNGGVRTTGSGYEGGRYIGGDDSGIFGTRAGDYLIGDRRFAFGYQADSVFNPDTGNDKTFAFGDVNDSLEFITILGHGLGPNLSGVSMLFTQGTSIVPGLTTGVIYQFRIFNSNTLELISGNMTGQGTGTGHTLTPQFVFADVHSYGNNSIPPNEANIIYFGGDHTKTIVDMDLEVTGAVTVNGLTEFKTSESVADDAFIDLPAGVSGWGVVSAGDNQEWTQFRFSADGTVTLLNPTANVVNTDTDTFLCVFDGGAFVRISNRLGAALTLKISADY